MRAYKLIVLNRKLANKWKPEGVYGSWFLKNLINKFVRSGNISQSECFIYNGLRMFKQAYGCHPAEVVVLIVEHFRLRMGLKFYKRGRSSILVPKLLPVSQSVRSALHNMKKLINSSQSEFVFNYLQYNLFIFLSSYMDGQVDYFSAKRLIYRVALRNKRFLHFRW